MTESIFNQLNKINVNDKVEKKNGLTYLAWAYAWGEVKKLYPLATYTIYERETEYGLVNYFTDGRTCWVKTGVTIDGLEHIEQLPVMDFRNNSITLICTYLHILFQFPKSDSITQLKHNSQAVCLNLFLTLQGLFEQYTRFSNILVRFQKAHSSSRDSPVFCLAYSTGESEI